LLSTDAWLSQDEPRPLLIDGRLRGLDQMKAVVVEPATGRPLGAAALATAAQGEEAVRSARHAADAGPWPRMTPEARAGKLRPILGDMEGDQAELARLAARESGLTLREAELCWRRALLWSERALAAAGRAWNWRPAGFGRDVLERPAPLGVVAVQGPAFGTTPDEFVLAMAALVRGNAVIWLAGEERPLLALRIAQHLARGGLPAGAVQVLAGGPELTEDLASHRGVDLAAGVGPEARLALRRVGGGRTYLRPWVKGCVAVFEGADLDVAAASAVLAATFRGGRSEWAAQRLYVTRKNHDHLLLRIISRLSSLQIGNPIDFDTEIGPVPGEALLAELKEHVARRQADGATLIYGGDQPTTPERAGGTYWRPALLLQAGAGEAAEVWGALLEVREAADDDELLGLAARSGGPCTVISPNEAHARELLSAGGPRAVAWNADWPEADLWPDYVDGLFATAPSRLLRSDHPEPSGWYRGG
jgi:acyl-CoA reductase-like NAD-dependent aldehyde dehydrogenase